MNNSGARRAFLVGMTLNELVFLLFFLLLIVSAVLLQNKGREADQQAEQAKRLFDELGQTQQQLDQAFKKLILQEAMLSRLENIGSGRDPKELDQFFSRLIEDRRKAAQLDQAQDQARALQTEVEALRRDSQTIRQSLDQAGIDRPVAQAVDALIATLRSRQQQNRDLQGRLGYVTNKLRAYQGSGVDHPPCWVDPVSGKIEYLYRITILENGLVIDAAWPVSRRQAAGDLPGALDLVGRTLSKSEFLHRARPIYDWSRQHGCRHFVRAVDAPSTSKHAFKDKLLTIEAYFYKLLERN